MKSFRFTLIIILTILIFISSPSISQIKNEYKLKKFSIKLSDKGKWQLIGKKAMEKAGSLLDGRFFVQSNNNKLISIIETLWVTNSSDFPRPTQTFFNDYTFQSNENYKSCIERDDYIVFDVNIRGGKVNCFIVRQYNPDKEIFNPVSRITTRYNTNYGIRILKSFFNSSSLQLPNEMYRVDHLYFTPQGLYAYYEMVDIKSFNISLEEFIKQSIKKHKIFEEQLNVTPNFKLSFNNQVIDNNKKSLSEIDDNFEKLEKLKKLFDEGILTKEEFSKAKKRILDNLN